jgi:hypothetical protein
VLYTCLRVHCTSIECLSRFRRQITTLSCGPKSWCAGIADRQIYSRCLCHCSSSELSYKVTENFGGLARRETAWPVVACIACVVPVIHCIRRSPAAMHVCAVAEVVLAAVESKELSLNCSSRAVVLCLVLYSCILSLQVASDVRSKAAELSNARVCKQLHCKRVLVKRILTKSGAWKGVLPTGGACCPNQTVSVLALQSADRLPPFVATDHLSVLTA